MNRLTVTLITRDEEKNLPRALASLGDLADEILVVDSGSTDHTCEIARQRGARVLERAWTNYSDQKNFAALHAAHDWILNLDADEELSPELQTSLRRWKTEAPTAVAYRIRRRPRYLGGWIHHSGWYPDPKLRLYRRERARFVNELHERLAVDGPMAWLEGDLNHYTVNTFEEHVRSVRRYTTLAAAQLFAAGRRRWLLPMLFASPWAFLRTFVLQQGFRDGYRGLLIAVMAAYYVFFKYRKLGVLARGRPLESIPGSGGA
jgi:glycosyltransferase involved in cell wall biosynthesis